MNIKCTLAALVLLPSILVAQEGANTAIQALQAIPGDYQDTVVKLSCSGADPDPEKWNALAYEGEVGDAPRNIVIAGGEVISNSLSAKIGTMLSHQTPITIGNVMVDSPAALGTAAEICSSKGFTLAAADLTLTQPGEGASPLWEIVCHDSTGKKIGRVSISAQDGAVVSESF